MVVEYEESFENVNRRVQVIFNMTDGTPQCDSTTDHPLLPLGTTFVPPFPSVGGGRPSSYNCPARGPGKPIHESNLLRRLLPKSAWRHSKKHPDRIQRTA